MPRITFNLVECSLTSWYLPSMLQSPQGRVLARRITRGRLKHNLKRNHIFVRVSWLLVYYEVVKKSLFDVLALGHEQNSKQVLRNALRQILVPDTHVHNTHTPLCVHTTSRFIKYREGISEVAGRRGLRIHHKEWDASHAFCTYGFDPDFAPMAY